MEYAGLEKPSENQRCAHKNCSCNGTLISPNAGYLHIEQKLIDCIRQSKAGQLNTRVEENSDKISTIGLALVCKHGAKSRNIDLKVAAADAEYWWKTGRVPMRVTPIAGTREAKMERKRIDMLEQLTRLRSRINEIDNPNNSCGFGTLTPSMFTAALLDGMVEYKVGKEPSLDKKRNNLQTPLNQINELAQYIGQNNERVVLLRQMYSIVNMLINDTNLSKKWWQFWK